MTIWVVANIHNRSKYYGAFSTREAALEKAKEVCKDYWANEYTLDREDVILGYLYDLRNIKKYGKVNDFLSIDEVEFYENS